MTITLYSLGSNGSGQLSLNHTKDTSTPQPVTLPFSPSSSSNPFILSAGGNHTILLSSPSPFPLISGSLPPNPKPTLTFSPLPLPEPIQYTSSTWTTTHLATPNTIYSLGHGPKGELGLSPSTLLTSSPTTPQQIPNFPPPNTTITQLSSSMSHTACLLSSKQVYAWGTARKGQIGTPLTAAIYSPRLIPDITFPVYKVLCGKEFTVLLGSPKTGQIKILGSDKFGIISKAPDSIKNWKDAGAGWGSVFILYENGTMTSWGRNDHGQMVPPGLGQVKMMAVGSEHVIGVAEENGNVVAWGWGEHGNCGTEGIGKNGDGKSFGLHTIYETKEGEEVVMVGAGCATSWFAVERRKDNNR
ncbi:regulator of chromosome condensation 1/beta-lactamase-inhibitor protein II [Podospora fimiseda]|uniref:Regulator of chromosome condensation 1/beta-lactamase-inhibitor protein II n=1 Tax=Podospora fimiseda TaxID=252190 RepID=A0AAN7BYR0_9PEZI|nr:regulator of chromosome condensation 1/beta-lactamase-inhibitor protein II [Podospora fimiseda]